MTYGAQFLKHHLNASATVGWHIDPFGHSSSTPSLWADIGFNAFGKEAIDFNGNIFFFDLITNY